MRTSLRRAATLALLLVAAASTALAQGGQAVFFGPTPPPGLSIETGLEGALDVVPGTSRTLTVTLRNAGNETLALNVRAMPLTQPGNAGRLQVAVANGSVTLAPGEQASVEVNVTVAADAPRSESAWFAVFAAREEPRQMLDERVPVRFGEPCPECPLPPEPDQGGMFVTSGPGGAGPGGDRVIRSDRPAANVTTATATPPALDEDDPYRETPGPGALVALGALAAAACARRVRARGLAALVILLALAPPTNAAGERTFAVTAVARDGDDALVTIVSNHGTPYDSILTLVDATGRLLAPEQARQIWTFHQPVTYRFPDVNATDVELRIHYFREGNVELEERLPLRLPAIPLARFDVVSVSLVDDTLAIGLANVGDASAVNATARLEDATGTRLGSPLTRTLTLDAGARMDLAFDLTRKPSALTLVLTHANATQRISFEVPQPDNATRLELVRAASFDNGTAEFVVAHLGGAPLHDVVAHLETDTSARMGEPSALLLGPLAEGDIATARFTLPDDSEAVRLVLDHAEGTRSFQVDLAEASGAQADLTLETELPSGEAQVGSSASYALRLENNGAEALVELRAEGLPTGFDVSFTVGGSAARSLVVPEDATRQVTISVSVPRSASGDAGRSFPFTVVATSAGEEARVPLTLEVAGAPKLDLAGQNWFATAQPGETKRVTVQLRNTGSASAQDVEMAVSAPTGWQVRFSPDSVDALAAGDARDIEIAITPPADAGAGRYVLDVSAAGSDVAARARSLSFEIAAEESSRVGWLVGAGIAGLAATALIVKLRRR